MNDIPLLNYETWKVSELNAMLEVRGLPMGGLKDDKIERLRAADSENLIETPTMAGIEPEVIQVKQPNNPPKKFYEERLWAGVKPIYVCDTCGRQEDSEDDMRLHVLSHYPENEREQILSDLLKVR